MKNREVIENLAKSYDSFYLYDEAVIREKANYLKDNFPGVQFLYSILLQERWKRT